MSNFSSPNRAPFFSISILLCLSLALPLIAYSMLSISSGSIDLAHHYALVVRLSEYWVLPNASDPSLGEMNFYPSVSHTMAAILGRIFDSPLIGMQLLAEIAVFVVWTVIAAMLLALPKRSAYIAAAGLVLLIILNRKIGHLFLHGDELVGSYFFAQIVAQAFAMCVLIASLYMERSQVPSYWRHVLFILSIYGICSIHLLPASELLGFFAATVFLDTLMCGWPKKKAAFIKIAGSIAIMLAGVLAFVRNPAYSAMKGISANDGGLIVPHLHTLPGIMGFTVFVLALSLYLTYCWYRLAKLDRGHEFIALKYIALYGVAVTVLCIAQYVALKIGQGSPYAVKKHMFAVTSALFVQLSVLPAIPGVFKKSATVPGEDLRVRQINTYLLLPLLAAIAFMATIPKGAGYNTASIVAVEKQLGLLHNNLLTDLDKKNVYVAGLSTLPPTFSYMFSISTFHTPRSAAYNLFQPIGTFDLDGVVIAPSQSSLAGFRTCQQSNSGYGLSLMEGKCVATQLVTAQQKIGLTSSSAPSPCKLTGFSAREDNGTWTDGPKATISCPMPLNDGKLFQSVHLNATVFLAGALKSQRVLLSIEEGNAVEYIYDSEHISQEMEIAIDHTAKKNITINLSMPNAAAPSELLDSTDARKLGIMLRTVEFK